MGRAEPQGDQLSKNVREGIAKKVPPDRVSSALDRRAQALREARRARRGLWNNDGMPFE